MTKKKFVSHETANQCYTSVLLAQMKYLTTKMPHDFETCPLRLVVGCDGWREWGRRWSRRLAHHALLRFLERRRPQKGCGWANWRSSFLELQLWSQILNDCKNNNLSEVLPSIFFGKVDSHGIWYGHLKMKTNRIPVGRGKCQCLPRSIKCYCIKIWPNEK